MKAIPISAQRRPEDDPASVSRGRPGARRRASWSASSPRASSRGPGMMAPFQRGLAADRQGADDADHPGPSRPADGQHLQPGRATGDWPERIPYPVTVSFGKPTAARLVAACEFRTGDPRARPGSLGVPQGRSPPAASRVSSVRRAGIRRGWRSPISRRLVSRNLQGAGRRDRDRARHCGRAGRASRPWGILLPASVGGALVNLAATMAGKAAVNLNFTAGRAGMESAAAQAGLRLSWSPAGPSSKRPSSTRQAESSSSIWKTWLRPAVGGLDRLRPCAWRSRPRSRVLERLGRRDASVRDGGRHRDHHLQQRQHGRAQGRRACRISTLTPTSRRSAQVYHVDCPTIG